MKWTETAAVLFDLDGVLTPTAEVHERAWARMFGEFLTNYDAQGDLAPYADADYFRYIDGKPRSDGVRSFLASRAIKLPDGTPSDSADEPTVAGLGKHKNDVFSAILRDEGVQAFAGSVALMNWLEERAIPMAVVSSSRNAPAVLQAAGLAHRFQVVVDGTVAADAGLVGKPNPDTYQYAATLLGAPAERTMVIEDAISGVQAGRAGNFWVVGVDRGAGRAELLANGADVVVDDLIELVEA